MTNCYVVKSHKNTSHIFSRQKMFLSTFYTSKYLKIFKIHLFLNVTNEYCIMGIFCGILIFAVFDPSPRKLNAANVLLIGIQEDLVLNLPKLKSAN